MTSRLPKTLASTFITLSTLGTAALMMPSPVAAQTEWTDGFCTMQGVATIQGLQCLIGNILSVALTIIGLAGFVMFIIGAFRYMLSGGNSKGTETARNTITFAVVGLVVALSAFMIINLIAAFTGINLIKNFTIPNSDTTYQSITP